MTPETDPNMSLVEAIETQRAIRRVSFEPISDELIMRIIELGTRAPNAMNKQEWEFIVVKDRAVKEKLGSHNRLIWNFTKFFMKRRAKNKPETAKVSLAPQWAVDNFEDYPAMIIACYKGSRFTYPPVLGSLFYGSIMPAIQNILLSARVYGLGANITNMPLTSNWYARKILGLPFSITPVMLITLGNPLGKYGYNKRKPVGDVVSFNQFGNRPYAGKTSKDISPSLNKYEKKAIKETAIS